MTFFILFFLGLLVPVVVFSMECAIVDVVMMVVGETVFLLDQNLAVHAITTVFEDRGIFLYMDSSSVVRRWECGVILGL